VYAVINVQLAKLAELFALQL